MKIKKTYQKNAYWIFTIIIISVIMIGLNSIWNKSIGERKNEINYTESNIEKEIQTVVISSEIIEIMPDYSNMPSYCDPDKYKIAKINNYYVVLLPYGTPDGYFKTAEEAQININERALISKNRWIKSGGLDY